jgi:hypothetical protein
LTQQRAIRVGPPVARFPRRPYAAVKEKLQKAATQLRAAIGNDNLDAAKKSAGDVQQMLK